MLPKFFPRHASQGFIGPTNPTNTTVIYLFNNSTGRDVLDVRQIQFQTASAGGQFAKYGQIKGHAGTSGGTIDTLVSGEAANPGVLYADDTATPPVGSNFVVDWGWNPAPYAAILPFGLVLPGWSLFVVSGDSAKAVQAAFVWQRIEATDIDFSLTDIALKLAGA